MRRVCSSGGSLAISVAKEWMSGAQGLRSWPWAPWWCASMFSLLTKLGDTIRGWNLRFRRLHLDRPSRHLVYRGAHAGLARAAVQADEDADRSRARAGVVRDPGSARARLDEPTTHRSSAGVRCLPDDKRTRKGAGLNGGRWGDCAGRSSCWACCRSQSPRISKRHARQQSPQQARHSARADRGAV